MNTIKHRLYATLSIVMVALVFGSCIKERNIGMFCGRNVSMQLSVDTRVNEVNGNPSDQEAKLYSLRVYAFVSGKPAGHYFVSGADMNTPSVFLMDLKMFSQTTQKVDFYVIANEKAMSTPGAEKQFDENTTEAELKNFSFTTLNDISTNGLPMFACEQVDVDMSRLSQDNPQEGEHDGHYKIDQTVAFSLQRPMAKLGLFAAKVEGETGELKITGAKILKDGTRYINYLMPQTDEVLKDVGQKPAEIILSVTDQPVDKAIASGADRTNPDYYTPLLTKAFYPFETPWGSQFWNQKGDEKGAILQIDYAFDGESKTGLVYLPRIKRNHYYTICCLMNNTGKMTVEYTVADWDDGGDYELGFEYPTYTNPLEPMENHTYEQPEVFYNSDENSESGTFSVYFTMTAPEGQEWQPTILNTTPGDFEITVYQGNVKVEPPYLASSMSYRIRVRALKPENVGKKAELGIAYTPKWDPEGSSLLMINGTNGDTKWPGSDSPEKIVIEQVNPAI